MCLKSASVLPGRIFYVHKFLIQPKGCVDTVWFRFLQKFLQVRPFPPEGENGSVIVAGYPVMGKKLRIIKGEGRVVLPAGFFPAAVFGKGQGLALQSDFQPDFPAGVGV